MSGGSIPYHLRTNKAIERRIFFDLLGNLALGRDLKNYKYISLGGPMLADHQALHHELGLTKLVSIERDSAVLTRQDFNKPYSCIECWEGSTSDYIHNFNEDDPVIIWLDYTDTRWGSQINDCVSLIENLKEYDIFKVTFNANPDCLKGNSSVSPLEVFQNKANCSQLSANLTPNDVSGMDRFALTISEMFMRATEDALGLEELVYVPLTQFRYIDNRHQMLTVTGIILPEEHEMSLCSLLHDSHLTNWPYIAKSWADIQEINVPDITLKERAEINRHLPCREGEFDLDALPFKLDRNAQKAKEKIDNYIKYYRFIPNFQRVVV
ncbi:TPA: O-methyltransferase [Vibrio vulnificus]|uniref:O-methyltransferase n=1 Tax=Vibrio TaxID=662 RepID=UPI000408F93B|nr:MULTISPECIES: O-methyltransferase [Vibrio]MBE4802479.1 hypothetical protein [Vibrio parahaemolyticus]EJK2994373.1 hypothetical protein [Vibrio cholerae]EKF9774789.1 hypothetical protein [Vibrio cholerae]ELJ8555922.1 hypothetical protein [Vibrio cholerae]ELJ8723232.1 hypothetical protein [Vibrio cholerae]